MLEINTSIDVNIRKIECPIYFSKRNICVHCGSEGTLKFIDKFSNITKKEIYPFSGIICTNCNTKYSIKWEIDDTNNKMYPCAVDNNIVSDFLNIFRGRSDNYIKELGDKNND